MSHVTDYAQSEAAGYYIPESLGAPKRVPPPPQETHRYCLVIFTGMQTRFYDEASRAEAAMTGCQLRGLPYAIFTYDETAGSYFPGINPPQP